MANAPRWPDGRDPGLLIGEAAGLLGISAKAIRVYHDRGLLPEAPRDASGYRRYGAAQLVGLARITRLRAVGLSLREIAPLVDADDGGARLRQALGDLDAALAEQVRECEQRRALLALVLDEGIDDPVAVSVADVWEERSVALLRRAIPDLTPEQELLERRFARALAALMPDTVPADDDALVYATLGAAADADGGWQFADQHRRFHALADVDADDPRVAALADELLAELRAALGSMPTTAPEAAPIGDAQRAANRQAMSGLRAALDVLAPAQARVFELVLPRLFEDASAAGP